MDNDYTILYADAGAQGRISDGGVFRDCSFNSCLSQSELNLPPPRPLPKSPDLKWAPWMRKMKCQCLLYLLPTALFLSPQTVWSLTLKKPWKNYRLSRFRRCSENAFGILSQVYGILRTAINLLPDEVRDLVLTSITLHNMLRAKSQLYVNATNSIAEECDGERSLVPLNHKALLISRRSMPKRFAIRLRITSSVLEKFPGNGRLHAKMTQTLLIWCTLPVITLQAIILVSINFWSYCFQWLNPALTFVKISSLFAGNVFTDKVSGSY